MTNTYCDVTRRHDFVFFFDVTDGNPNGDPDAGNMPRVDPETMEGLVTDVALKRKVRNWVMMSKGDDPSYGIYIQSRDIGLNEIHKAAHQAVFPQEAEQPLAEEEETGKKAIKGSKKGDKSTEDRTVKESSSARQSARRDWLCKHFYDVRTFGAVMSTGDYPSGQVRGPLQLTFSRSLDPIAPLDLSITRLAVADIDPKKKTTSTMGRKSIVPYGLYMGHGFFVPHFARQTGFSERDLELFWLAFQSMWDLDRSASRGMLALRRLFIFSHENALGNAPSHRLFGSIQTRLKNEKEVPRSFDDYTIMLDDAQIPEGVVTTQLV